MLKKTWKGNMTHCEEFIFPNNHSVLERNISNDM